MLFLGLTDLSRLSLAETGHGARRAPRSNGPVSEFESMLIYGGLHGRRAAGWGSQESGGEFPPS